MTDSTESLGFSAQRPHATFSDRLREFRSERGLTSQGLADLLGIAAYTVRRWEAGASRPNRSLAAKLTDHGFGAITIDETNSGSRSRIKTSQEDELPSPQGRALSFEFPQIPGATAPAWARNGPPDQDEFYRKLVRLQLSGLPPGAYDRLSVIECYRPGQRTTQSLLEAPKDTAAAWNSNYGSHGWHRYVGRFPAHVVRALLNHFGAGPHSLVCDPFSGSGTTAVECRLLGIPFIGIEICPLSHLMAKVKSAFSTDPLILVQLSQRYKEFMQRELTVFNNIHSAGYTVVDVLNRTGNSVPHFANCEKWFTPEAILGVSLTMEFASQLEAFEKEALLLALSAKMRSIGNVDVDVVRAEYSRKPREGVAVDRLVERQLKKMANGISAMTSTHHSSIGLSSSIRMIEGSALQTEIEPCSIDCIITSPPYGVEALSYLRTHLLSYRSLAVELKHDPYDTRDQTIGSEYLEEAELPRELQVAEASAAFRRFFGELETSEDKNTHKRRIGMMKFFEDMHVMGQRIASWLKDGGKIALIVGNKRLGESVIPTDTIIEESFRCSGLTMYESIRHKLKTNNSNSQVPWQERIIQEEAILIFQRVPRDD